MSYSAAVVSTASLPLNQGRYPLLLIKHIKCGLIDQEGRPRRIFPFPAKSQELTLSFELDGTTINTTDSKVEETNVRSSQLEDARYVATWNEHIIFELIRPIKDEMVIRCFDNRRAGQSGFMGEAKVDLATRTAHENKVSVELIKHGDYLSSGRIAFDMYYLGANPPNNISEDERGEGEIRKIGILLLRGIECRGLKKNGHLEFMLNKPKNHSTFKYWNTSRPSRFPIAIDLLAKERRQQLLTIQCRFGGQTQDFAKARLNIGSDLIWDSLTNSAVGYYEVSNTLTEGSGFDAGTIKFNISLHEIVTFEEIHRIESPSRDVPHQVLDVNIQPNGTLNSIPGESSVGQVMPEQAYLYVSPTQPSLQQLQQPPPPPPQVPPQVPPQPWMPFNPYAAGYMVPPQSNVVCGRYNIMFPYTTNSTRNTTSLQGTRNQLFTGEHMVTGEQCIIKVYSRQDYCENETKFLRSLRSRFVVKLRDMDTVNLVLVTKHCGQNLENETHGGRFIDEMSKKRVFLNICQALSFIHSRNVVHNNLNPENILWKQDKIRLCDFESACQVGGPIRRKSHALGWSAPEIVQNRESRSQFSQDVFSLGCIFYFVMTKRILYESLEQLQNLSEVVQSEIRNIHASQLMQEMLDFDPTRRPTIRSILESSYLRGGEET